MSNKPIAISWKGVLAGLIVSLLLFLATGYTMWRLAMSATHTQVSVAAVLAILLLPITFLTGHWFGRTEVRGFLSGVDTAVDRIAKAVDLRDGAKVTVHQKIAAPQAPTYPAFGDLPLPTDPPLPRLTFSEAREDQIIDL